MRVEVSAPQPGLIATATHLHHRRTDVRWFALAMCLATLASVIDVGDVLDRGPATRYLLLVVPMGSLLLVRLGRPTSLIRRPTPGDVCVLLLVVFGLVGAFYGSAFLGTKQTARPIFIPMVLGLASLFLLDRPSESEVASIFRWISWIATTYVVFNFIVNINVIPGLVEYRQYRNASFSFVALAIGCAVIKRRWVKLAITCVLTAGIFATYPSATSALIVLGTGLTLFVTGKRATGFRTGVVLVCVMAAGGFLLANFGSTVDLASRYFDLVNKARTESGRIELWSKGLSKFEESPIFGEAFAGDIVTIRDRDEQTIPFHNDYVLFLASGGIVGLGLLLGWIVSTEATLLRRHREYRDAGDRGRADLVRATLVVLNGFIVAMAFNPVLGGITRSAAIFGLSAIALSLGRPTHVRSRAARGGAVVVPSI